MCSVHTSVELETRGIPATVSITAAVRSAAVFQFKGKGMEGHPSVEMPHPISNLKPEEMEALTLKYVDQVVRQLTA